MFARTHALCLQRKGNESSYTWPMNTQTVTFLFVCLLLRQEGRWWGRSERVFLQSAPRGTGCAVAVSALLTLPGRVLSSPASLSITTLAHNYAPAARERTSVALCKLSFSRNSPTWFVGGTAPCFQNELRRPVGTFRRRGPCVQPARPWRLSSHAGLWASSAFESSPFQLRRP